MQFSIGGPSGDMADAGVRAFCEVVTREHPFQHRHGGSFNILRNNLSDRCRLKNQYPLTLLNSCIIAQFSFCFFEFASVWGVV